MKTNAPPARRSIRLPTYNYRGSGAYFVTVCSVDRGFLFGVVRGVEVQLTAVGRIVAAAWSDLPNHHSHVALDAFVVMPNHVHGVLLLGDERATGAAGRAPTALPRHFGPPEAGSLSTIIRSFKSSSTREANALRNTPGQSIWQRNYYEHVIRDDEDLYSIRRYISDNPTQWALDDYHPDRLISPANNRRV